MFKKILLIGIMLVVCLSIFSDEKAEKLLKDMDESLFPKNFISKMEMTNYKPRLEDQTFEMAIYNKDEKGSLVIFTKPSSEKGKKMLFLTDTVWLYVPGTTRALSLSARQSFMGSTFSNSDMMDSTMHNDYDPVIIKEENLDGNETYLLELSAKNNKVTYKKILLWIRKDYKVPVKIEYYTLSGKLLRVTTMSELKKISGRVRPTLMKMTNVLQKDTFTEVKI